MTVIKQVSLDLNYALKQNKQNTYYPKSTFTIVTSKQ